MATERQTADEILGASGLSASKLGLRFDRVVVRVLGHLRSFADRAVPDDLVVVLTISAPIRVPAKTVARLEREIEALLSEGVLSVDRRAAIHANQVRLRLARNERPGCKLIGFVHKGDTDAKPLLDCAERWLRTGG